MKKLSNKPVATVILEKLMLLPYLSAVIFEMSLIIIIAIAAASDSTLRGILTEVPDKGLALSAGSILLVIWLIQYFVTGCFPVPGTLVKKGNPAATVVSIVLFLLVAGLAMQNGEYITRLLFLDVIGNLQENFLAAAYICLIWASKKLCKKAVNGMAIISEHAEEGEVVFCCPECGYTVKKISFEPLGFAKMDKKLGKNDTETR